MQRPQFNILIKSQAGIGYMAILVLLAILSTMGLAFIYKVGLMSSVTLNRRTSMQAHYLAESAANHALWLMLNDPGFTPESDKYYMHSLGDGRYGYNVRMPTETTFATVATVGAMGDIATQQSYVQYIIPSNVLSAYARTMTPTIQYRRLIGAHWTDPADTPNIPIPTVYWVEMEGCPVRKEIIMGSIDGPDDINLVVWDGTSWGNPHTFGQDANNNYKCFDIAYESQSGRALVVGRTDGTATVRYNIWDGTAWIHASAQPAFNLAGGAARLVVMAPCPGNDQILIATVNSLFDLQLFLWNGSVFTDLGVIETSTHSDQPGTVEIVYEQQSGDALVIWTVWSATPKIRVWNGVTLGPENIVPIFPDNVYFLRTASDPTSDHIVVAGVDKFYDVQVGIWDGTAWPDSREVETDNANQVQQGVDVAWEASGEDALVVWVPWSSGSPIVRSLAWKKGTALADSTIEPGPDVQNQPWLVRLLPISQSEKIILLVENNTNDLRYSLWDGERLKGDPGILLESNISVQNELAFDLTEANVPRSGGTGSGIVTNQPPTVDAGLDETIYLPINQVDLDGTVTDDGLPNPPATVTTTWSVVSGPGTVNIDDSSSVDTVARFSDVGEYVLVLTADDSNLSAFDEVTIIISPCTAGNFRDEFTTISYSGNNGSEDWSNSWQEQGESDGSSSGLVRVVNTSNSSSSPNALRIGRIEGSIDGLGVSRTAGLSDAGFATLSFWYKYQKVDDGGGSINLSVWDDDNSLWVSLDTFDQSDATGTYSYNITAYISANTQIRFLGSGFSTGSYFYFDDVQIEAICEPACDADYAPDTKIAEFSTSAYGSVSLEGVGYLPEGKSFKLTAVPAGGALITVDMGDTLYMTDLAGNLLTSLAMPSGSPTGVTLVQTGTWADHLAVSDKFSDEIKYFDLSGNPISSFSTDVSADFNGTTPEDVAFIGTTASGTYDNHLAIPDLGRDKVFLVDQNGNWVSSIDIFGIIDNVKGAAHVPGTDKLLLVDLGGQAFIVDFLGNLLNQYDTATFGTDSPTAVTINPLTCNHLVADDTPDLIVTLKLLGGGNDTDPPTPDPMTWAGPPTADGPYSIRMTASTASDPSGVEYYFECTAGGGSDSGWQDSATYADTGLSSTTSYTYRVKARDKSASQNETDWSPEASATTTSNVMYVQDIAMGYRKHATKRWGQATVWIRSVDGANISGAIVSGDWSGAVSGTSMGTTGSDGKVMLESPEKKDGGTFIFTVTNVTKLGYIYNSSLNVETSDSITPP